MTIKTGNKIPFHGILAIGGTKDDAVNAYRKAALGKGVHALTDQSHKMSFVTSSESPTNELFNPLTGDLDLEESPALASSLKFESRSSGDLEAIHFVCESGCGSHLVYDSEALVKFCPVCTTALSADDAAEDPEASTDDEEGDGDEDVDTTGDDEEDSDGEDEDDVDAEDDEDDSDGDDEDGDESDDEDDAEDADEDESTDGDESDDEDDSVGSPLVIASTSYDKAAAMFSKAITKRDAASGKALASSAEVEYVVCSSAKCGAHILSESSDTPVDTCPVCSAKTAEPPAVEDGTAAVPPAAPATEPAAATASDDLGTDGDDEDEDEDEDHDEPDGDEDGEGPGDGDEDDEAVAGSYGEALKLFRKQKRGTAVASAVEANYVVCSSAGCGAHIISTKDVDTCPTCKSKVKEPVLAGDDATTHTKVTSVDPQELLEVDALTHLEDGGDDAHKDLDLSYSSSIGGAPMWTAFYKGRPVATARSADAGKNADIFEDSAFGHAVLASAKHVGVKNILTEMGFKGVVNQVAIASVVKAGVDKEVAVASENLNRDRKEFADRLMAALATAAIGVNRGFFSDVKNPLKEKLWDAMATAGIHNPEVLIHNAFRTSSDEYHKTLFAKAAEIMEKPLEVQESLSKAVLGTNYMSSESNSVEPTSSLEQRLGEFGTVTASAKPSVPGKENETSLSGGSGASVDVSHIVKAVSSLGRRR